MAYDALVERKLSMPRAQVFAALYDFGGVKNILPDAISQCDCTGEGVGAMRYITLADGGKVSERMDVAHDDTVFAYSILENTALPLEHYCAVVTLSDVEGGTLVSYGSNWTPKGAEEDDVRAALEGLYNAILDGIVKNA
ncbi:MAG: SRPBCC family protein [Gammaproteobacteria bacterium]